MKRCVIFLLAKSLASSGYKRYKMNAKNQLLINYRFTNNQIRTDDLYLEGKCYTT